MYLADAGLGEPPSAALNGNYLGEGPRLATLEKPASAAAKSKKE
jgi:hypothetical protein